jgi:uncharacterized beta-barrel protein YwiB (DUF1934 family)
VQKARVSIVTQINGEAEQSASFDAELELGITSARLRYVDGASLVNLSLADDEVTIERKGDYTFLLRLKEGERLSSFLGFGDALGEIFTQTHTINYSITKNSLLLSVKYALCFDGGEKQEMKIRLLAKSVTEEK